MPKNKMLLVVGAVALVGALGAFAVIQFTPKTQESAQNNAPTQNENYVQEYPEATGSIDASVDAILSESSDDATLSSEEEADSSMITYDDQEVSSFNQTHDESQF